MGGEHLAPGRELALEGPARVGRAGRGQAVDRQAQRAGVARVLETLAAVVRDRLQPRAAGLQAREVVELRVLDRAVEAAFALAGGVDVPDAQAMGAQGVGSCLVVHVVQRQPPEGAEDFPELILRVRIVTLCPQRGHAREAAEHDQWRAGVEDGAQAMQAQGRQRGQGHEASMWRAVPTGGGPAAAGFGLIGRNERRCRRRQQRRQPGQGQQRIGRRQPGQGASAQTAQAGQLGADARQLGRTVEALRPARRAGPR